MGNIAEGKRAQALSRTYQKGLSQLELQFQSRKECEQAFCDYLRRKGLFAKDCPNVVRVVSVRQSEEEYCSRRSVWVSLEQTWSRLGEVILRDQQFELICAKAVAGFRQICEAYQTFFTLTANMIVIQPEVKVWFNEDFFSNSPLLPSGLSYHPRAFFQFVSKIQQLVKERTSNMLNSRLEARSASYCEEGRETYKSFLEEEAESTPVRRIEERQGEHGREETPLERGSSEGVVLNSYRKHMSEVMKQWVE